MHANYRQVLDRTNRCHEQNRNPAGIDERDVILARLYTYAFRMHVIGAFHATRVALDEHAPASPLAAALRRTSTDALTDLGNLSMEEAPRDFRVVMTTFYRYHQGVTRAMESLDAEARETPDVRLRSIADRFRRVVEGISGECGVHLSQDTHAPEQASFVVPGLGIVIAPLVYGDHHSWNLAYLAGEHRDVPTHRHQHGVEIHLGYNPTHGMTVLGDYRAEVDDGYAMPIPPMTDHGWVNTGDEAHHVPFIFGSLAHGGWGVFLDVEPRMGPIEQRQLVDRDSPRFNQMVYLERELDQAARLRSSWRKILIPHTVTRRGDSGGLELGLTRANPSGYSYDRDSFRIVSIARGEGVANIEGVERTVGPHDHFGVPAEMSASIRQTTDQPLVALDSLIKGFVS